MSEKYCVSVGFKAIYKTDAGDVEVSVSVAKNDDDYDAAKVDVSLKALQLLDEQMKTWELAVDDAMTRKDQDDGN